MRGGDRNAIFRAYIKSMRKALALFSLLAAFGAGSVLISPVLAQALPDPAYQRAQAQAQIDQSLAQTQQNNANMQYQVQQNQIEQQQQFNAMPPPAYQMPAYQQPAYAPPRSLTPGTP